MKKSAMPKSPLDVKSCAEFLGDSEHAVRRMIRIGYLEAEKEGKVTLFDLTQIQALRREIAEIRKRVEIADKPGAKFIPHDEIAAWLKTWGTKEEKDAPTIDSPRTLKSRIALAKMVTRLFDLWKLNTQEQLALLGLSERSQRTLARYRKGSPLADRRDLLDRVAVLLSIHCSLRILFPKNRALAYKWLKTPNRVFAGQSPLDVVRKDGFLWLLTVKRYLDFERNLTDSSTK